MALLEVRGLEKWYGRRQVVNGVDFDVSSGEVVGLLGPNGAGKTTVIKMLLGLVHPDAGEAMLLGRRARTACASASPMGATGSTASRCAHTRHATSPRSRPAIPPRKFFRMSRFTAPRAGSP